MSLEKIEARDRQGGGEMTPAEREAIDRVRARVTPYRYHSDEDHDAYVVFAALDKAEVEIARLREALEKGDGAISAYVGTLTGATTKEETRDGVAGFTVDIAGMAEAFSALCDGLVSIRAALSPKDGAGE